MKDSDLADEIIKRLNKLIESPQVREDIGRLLNERIDVSPETCDHPTIQVQSDLLGTLGFLNGLVGIIEDEGPKKGWGYITGHFDDEGKLLRFSRTENS